MYTCMIKKAEPLSDVTDLHDAGGHVEDAHLDLGIGRHGVHHHARLLRLSPPYNTPHRDRGGQSQSTALHTLPHHSPPTLYRVVEGSWALSWRLCYGCLGAWILWCGRTVGEDCDGHGQQRHEEDVGGQDAEEAAHTAHGSQQRGGAWHTETWNRASIRQPGHGEKGRTTSSANEEW